MQQNALLVQLSEFQSTLLREERLLRLHGLIEAAVVSIHAPARGATVPVLALVQLNRAFQSTLLREERPCHG